MWITQGSPLCSLLLFLFIKSDKRFIQIQLSEVYYLESYGNYVKIWMEQEFHLAARTLTSFEDQLPKPPFFRIHKSFLVNQSHIHYLEGNCLVMKNEKELAIGKNHRTEVKRYISGKAD